MIVKVESIDEHETVECMTMGEVVEVDVIMEVEFSVTLDSGTELYGAIKASRKDIESQTISEIEENIKREITENVKG